MSTTKTTILGYYEDSQEYHERHNNIESFVKIAKELIGPRWHTVAATYKEESGAEEDYVVMCGYPADILVLFKFRSVQLFPYYENSKKFMTCIGHSKESYRHLLEQCIKTKFVWKGSKLVKLD